MNALLARLGIKQVDWVGTSLGGPVGMVMSGFSGSIVRRLVINDIGPFVTPTGLQRIGHYIGNMPAAFTTIEQGEAYFRNVLEPYGHLSDEHWRHLTVHSLRWSEEGEHYAMLCDPMIAKAFKTPWYYSALDLWRYWEATKGPILVLRGASSDLLSRELMLEMRKRNRNADVFHFDVWTRAAANDGRSDRHRTQIPRIAYV